MLVNLLTIPDRRYSQQRWLRWIQRTCIAAIGGRIGIFGRGHFKYFGLFVFTCLYVKHWVPKCLSEFSQLLRLRIRIYMGHSIRMFLPSSLPLFIYRDIHHGLTFKDSGISAFIHITFPLISYYLTFFILLPPRNSQLYTWYSPLLHSSSLCLLEVSHRGVQEFSSNERTASEHALYASSLLPST